MKAVSRWMRVSIASGVLGAALVAMLAPGATADGTGHSRASIVCPGAQPGCCGPILGVRADLVPCCPVPTVAGCCGPVVGSTCCTATSCPAALSIAASPNPANEGKEATITGTLTGPTVVAQTVDLYERLAGQPSFANVAHAQTNVSGAFSFARALTTNGEWYAQAASVQSPTISESVLAAVVLKPSSVRPKAGAKLKLSGTIAPSHAGERVALQRLRRGQWVTVARPKLGAHSRFTVAEKMSGHAVARFRVVLAADARNARSVSGVVAIATR